jgi:hypothetical protein
VSYSEEDLFHIERAGARLKVDNLKAGFSRLLAWAEANTSLYVVPVPHGSLSVIHLATRAHARPRADCEMGFYASQKHIRWYFRRPGFESGLFSEREIMRSFRAEKNVKKHEMMFNMHSGEEVDTVIYFVENALANRG